MAHFKSEGSSLPGEDEGFVVFAAAAQTAALPVIRDGKQKRVIEFRGQSEHEIKMRDGGFHCLFSHGDHAFRHAQTEVIGDGQAGARSKAWQ